MGYPSLPSARRMHYEIDGTVVGYNNSNYGTGLTTVLSSAQMIALDGETPTVDSNVVGVPLFMYFLFPELRDITNIMTRMLFNGGGGTTHAMNNLQGSTDTTNGADGTWTAITKSGTLVVTQNGSTAAMDWWRSTSPGSLSANNTGLKAVRFDISISSGAPTNDNLRNAYLWGAKHSGETADDIIFLESDGATEWPNDDDWGDVLAGVGGVTHTYYVKNTSPTKTANTITVKASGSDNAKWTVSLDNSSFASSKSIASLAPGATQVVYVKMTPPALASGVYRPYAYYLESDVTSWT